MRNVPCVTFDALCDKHGFDTVDLVQIDTEGHDFEVIKLIDLVRLAPRVLLYEHHHLGEQDRQACLAHLTAHGFEMIEYRYDTLALRTTRAGARDRPLLRLWAELRNSGEPS